jgi:ATP-dependent exoDNAse (exonuclease V) beta subunit
VANNCPTFGTDTVLDRPDERAFDEGVRAGLHVFEEGGYGVVWWGWDRNRKVLKLDAPAQFGVRQRHLLSEKKVAAATRQADVERFHAWQRDKEAAVAAGSSPSLDVFIATDPTAPRVENLAKVELISLPREANRPAGPRFGALVHAALATVPLEVDRQRIEDAVALQARVLGATPEEAAAAIAVVENALRHPLLKRAQQAHAIGKCRRETPVTLRTPNGTIVEGVVDLAFEEDGGWIVVDLKTDAELEGRLEPYERQAGLYATAIAEAMGTKVAAILLRV